MQIDGGNIYYKKGVIMEYIWMFNLYKAWASLEVEDYRGSATAWAEYVRMINVNLRLE